MSKLIRGNGKQLTLKDRIDIEEELTRGHNFSYIAKLTCKDPTTISREVYSHRVLVKSKHFSISSNHCMLKDICKRTLVCSSCHRAIYATKTCRTCSKCNVNCKDFVLDECPTCKYAPYVCNGCNKTRTCHHNKYFYRAKAADKQYRERLVSSRLGFNISEKDMYSLDEIVTPLIAQGQSPYQIVANNPELNISSRSIYRYIEAGALTAKNIDLQRKVRYKVRKSTKEKIAIDKGIYIGRTYEDFNDFCASNKSLGIVEMDTVIGSLKSQKVILTIFFRESKFMLAYLLKTKTATNVVKVFDMLEEKLGKDLFYQTFPIILTDRGTEFMRPDEIEMAKDGSFKTSIFYCQPQSPYQKGALEKNHEYIRYILPKGTSFDNLTQEKLDLMMSHINSTKRAILNGKSPYELALKQLPKEAMKVFNIKLIPSDKIILKPFLLK